MSYKTVIPFPGVIVLLSPSILEAALHKVIHFDEPQPPHPQGQPFSPKLNCEKAPFRLSFEAFSHLIYISTNISSNTLVPFMQVGGNGGKYETLFRGFFAVFKQGLGITNFISIKKFLSRLQKNAAADFCPKIFCASLGFKISVYNVILLLC